MKLTIDLENKKIEIIGDVKLDEFIKFIEKTIEKQNYKDWTICIENKQFVFPSQPQTTPDIPFWETHKITCKDYSLDDRKHNHLEVKLNQ